MGVGVSKFPGKQHYEGVRIIVISVTSVWEGVRFSENALHNT